MIRHFFLVVTCLFVCITFNEELHFVLSKDSAEATNKAAIKDAVNISTSVKQDVHSKRKDTSEKLDHSGADVDLPKPVANNVTANENLNTTQVSVLPTAANNLNSTIDVPKWFQNIKSGALQRTGFVVLGIMSILLFFFLIHAIRVRQKRSKSRKYGIIASNASDVEMEPLEKGSVEDDEEETTLFDAQHKFRIK